MNELDQKADKTLQDNTAVMLVTGGAKRIGAAIIKAAHDKGYRVIIHCHRSQQRAERLAKALNSIRADSASVVVADLALVNNQAELNDFVQHVIEPFGQLDVLVHNASRFYPTPIGSIDNPQWDELMLTNAKAPLLLSQALLPYLQVQQGCIVSLLDIHAYDKPFSGYTVYNMAKAAQRTMVQSLALELAPDVRVNGVAPGVNILPDANSDQALDQAQQDNIVRSIPMQRIGTPEDIAQSVLFLIEALYITGHIINIDGGRSLTLAGD
ncbi:pteridine reductase [Psychrobacter sp. M13]|uniref:pteridine reductase n=1 Tax=Psychrobacter sp. M13 TaxID=3067275 RepID=UPI00273AD18B|nr:pteridine reductase [Psychrobacter sp. M13]WLP95516.1 pteridine reductase [Psychrobacter sp. M13]